MNYSQIKERKCKKCGRKELKLIAFEPNAPYCYDCFIKTEIGSKANHQELKEIFDESADGSLIMANVIKQETEQEHTIYKPISVKFEKGKESTIIPCAECKTDIPFPNIPPPSPNGYACEKCSRKLMLEYIREGNMRVDDFPQLEAIKKMIWDEYKLEVVVRKGNYLAIN